MIMGAGHATADPPLKAEVTGGARGIGLETAKALKENGAQIVIVDINEEAGDKAAKEQGFDFIRTDLTHSNEVATLAEQVQARYGHIDIAFNNAGIAVNMVLLKRSIM
jgi:NAD(P)-dependent dehydrogenase (short-subunit alcohol dehydrogenase family)